MKLLSPKRMTASALVELTAAQAEGAAPSRPSFTINAYNGGLVRPCWSYGGCVVIDLAGLRAAEPIAILLDHYDDQIVGQSTSVKIDASSVNVAGIVTGDTANPDDPAGKVVLHSRNGFVWKASVGVMPERIEEVLAGNTVTVNGKEFAGPLYVIRSGVLDEVSFLSIGADKTATAKVAASAAKEINMDFHEWLKLKGFDPTALEDTQRDSLLKAFKAEVAADEALKAKGTNGKPAADTDLEAVLVPAKLKQVRRAAVNATVAKFADLHPQRLDEIEAGGRLALAEDWTSERLELHFFRELGSIPINNAQRASGPVVEDQKVIEAALCRFGGLPTLEKQFSPEVLELSERKYRHGMGMKQLIHIAARSNGLRDFDQNAITDELLHAAFPSRERMRGAAGPTIFDISGVLSNVANKFIVNYFMGVDSNWQNIAASANLRDFKQATFYSLTGDMTYEEVAPGGELKHGNLGNTSYTLQAKTYGKMFQIDRRDLINDDLNAFDQIARRLGRGGALAINDAFWTRFLDNTATMFTVGNGNFFAGAATALSLSSLETAEASFMKMTDPNGKPLGVLPWALVVPPELKRTALQILNSTELRDNTASLKYGTTNTFAGDFRVISSPYMSNTAFTGSSATKWYLLANPLDIPTHQVGFLNGVRVPTVEQAMADFDTLGIKIRGYFDFAVGTVEPRGGLAMKGVV